MTRKKTRHDYETAHNSLQPKNRTIESYFGARYLTEYFIGFFELFSLFAGKFKKQRSYEHNSLFEAVMLSIENLNDYHKKLYKQLAVFLDDVGIPPKVFFIFTNLRLSMPKMTSLLNFAFLKLTHIKKRASKILNAHFKI